MVLELQVIVSHLMRTVGTEPGLSARAVCTLKDVPSFMVFMFYHLAGATFGSPFISLSIYLHLEGGESYSFQFQKLIMTVGLRSHKHSLHVQPLERFPGRPEYLC